MSDDDIRSVASKIISFRACRGFRRWFFWNGQCVAFVKGAPIVRRQAVVRNDK